MHDMSFSIGLLSHPLGGIFPKTLSEAIRKSEVKCTIENQVTYTVCPNDECCALYKPDVNIRCCTHDYFGKVCGSPLGYEASLAHGKKRLKVYKKFKFYPPSAWLKMFFSRNDFVDLLELKPRHAHFLEDVYDGRVWKEFSSCNFFSTKFNLGLALSTDWFKPFKRSEYKVAAIMLTILNLPREERFKKKWTIIAGIIIIIRHKFIISTCTFLL